MAKETQDEREPKRESRASRRDDEWLRCVACGHAITPREARIGMHGEHVHTFVNPVGQKYSIGCFSSAPGCAGAGDEQSFWTWFPGHTWRVALCRECNTHVGWSFRAAESAFWGLMVDRVA
jgi:hypothetical protein